jgi:hypothetical protein
MKRLVGVTFAMPAALALALCSVAIAVAAPSGTYRTKIHTTALHGAVNGTWTISFKNGAYTVTDDGAAVIHGKYSISADKITLRDKSGKDACPAPGTYRFALADHQLKFTKVSDANPACIGRVTVLAGKFTKVA